MIQVDELTKFYGPFEALKGISFSVERGEIVGFLGPNGAGKSTTMKILTGYLLPSGGRAEIAGLDVVRDSLEVRRSIGYLPESTPLYTEMRVDDYLRFAAADPRGPQGRRCRRSNASSTCAGSNASSARTCSSCRRATDSASASPRR